MPDNSLNWYAHNLRFTGFFCEPVNYSNFDIWGKYLKKQPDDRTHKIKQDSILENGYYEDLFIQTEINSFRLDINFIPDSQNPKQINGFPIIDNRDITVEAYKKVINEVLKDCTNIFKRIAFGAILLAPVASKEIGYKNLDVLLPAVRLDADNSSDFLYQINRPQKNAFNNINVNRLTKWSVFNWKQFQANILTESTIQTPPSFALRLELDINSSPEHESPLENPYELLKVLIEKGLDIAENGDQI